MKKKLIVTRKKNYIISALTDENNRLIDICADHYKAQSLVDNIYIGRVENVLPNIHASFVEFQPGQTGFIPDILKPGEKVMVQVVKDSIHGKEPVLSRTPVLTGKYVILTSRHPGIHFSYKFKDPEKKKQLMDSFDSLGISGCGFIIRTKSMYVENDKILNELTMLYQEYSAFANDPSGQKLFSRIYQALPAHLSYLLNSRQNELLSIITDDEPLYEEMKHYLDKFQPEDLDKLSFYEEASTHVPLHVVYSLGKQLQELYSRKVYLPSGGHLIIDQTEALHVIDVNSASDVRSGFSPDEYLKINVEAAEEAARQIRLRNLSGIILIDFINMSNFESKQKLLEILKKNLDKDPLGPNVVDMTKLGIVEITRKRTRKPLSEQISPDLQKNIFYQ